MNGRSKLLLVCGLLLLTPAWAAAQLPTGTWKVNGNGFEGDLNITGVGHDGRVIGTIYGEVIHGTYDEKTRCLSFVRIRHGTSFQAWKGYLSMKLDEKGRKTLAGTYVHLEPSGPSEAGWFAIPGEATSETKQAALPSLADDMKHLQGNWEVQSIIWALGQKAKLPADLGLNQKGNGITIEGNRLMLAGKVVATFDNDLPRSPHHAEVGLAGFRLMMLTLPDGKSILCSYKTSDGGVEIAYPHTCACRRGSGQIVALGRTEKAPSGR